MTRQVQLILLTIMIVTGCSGKVPKLGIENGALKECPATPNCVNSQAEDKKHFIRPIVTADSPQQAGKQLLNILKTLKRCKVTVVEDHYIRAEFTSKLFRFVDDVEFSFAETQDGPTTIHMRSASRVGHSDMGVNRKRIEQIRKIYITTRP